MSDDDVIETIERVAKRIAELGTKQEPLTMEQALEQVIVTGSHDVREYAKELLARIRGAR